MKTILIIGASGQVGQICLSEFEKRGFEVVGADSLVIPNSSTYHVDLQNHDAVRDLIRSVRPATCILTAALTNVEQCEIEPHLAKAINTEGPGIVANECNGIDCKVIYFSTEYVFDGTNGPYSENDPVSPISVYGKSKLDGERLVLSSSPRNLSVRTTVVYSYHERGMNFMMQLWNRLHSGERMRVPVDQISSPTYAPDLVQAIAGLVEIDASGIYNIAGPDVIDRYNFAIQAAQALGLPSSLIEPVDTPSLRQKAKRPLKAGLSIGKLTSAIDFPMKGINTGIAAFLDQAQKSIS